MEFVLPQPSTLAEIARHYEQIPEGMKRCGVCGEILPHEAFPWVIRDVRRCYCCSNCKRAKNQEAYRARAGQGKLFVA